MWGQRDYQLYPLLSNPPFKRGFSHGNGRRNRRGFHPQMTSERNQRDKQEEEWSILASVERRGGDIPVGQESLHRTPSSHAPWEDRFFADWSSLRSGSPHVRMPQCSGKRNKTRD